MTKEKAPGLKNFEKSLNELETLVGELDSDQVTLEESLQKFEKGVKLYKECYDSLSFAQKKIQILTDSLKLEEYQKED